MMDNNINKLRIGEEILADVYKAKIIPNQEANEFIADLKITNNITEEEVTLGILADDERELYIFPVNPNSYEDRYEENVENILSYNEYDELYEAAFLGGEFKDKELGNSDFFISIEEYFIDEKIKEIIDIDRGNLLENVFDNQYQISAIQSRIESHKSSKDDVREGLAEDYEFQVDAGVLLPKDLELLEHNRLDSIQKEIDKEKERLHLEEVKQQAFVMRVEREGYNWNQYLKDNKIDELVDAQSRGGMDFDDAYEYVHSTRYSDADREEAKNELKKEGITALGTIIYEPNNPEQQVLMVQDYESGFTNEYRINDSLYVEHSDKQIPVAKFLKKDNVKKLSESLIYDENTSFILDQEELQNIKAQGIELDKLEERAATSANGVSNSVDEGKSKGNVKNNNEMER